MTAAPSVAAKSLARTPETRPRTDEPTNLARFRVNGILLRTLVLFRWAGIFGQTTTILVVAYFLKYDLPVVAPLATVGASVVFNLYLTFKYPFSKRLSEKETAVHLVFDTLQLSILLYLTGGLHNPFSFFLPASVIVSATVLTLRTTAMLIGLTVVSAIMLIYVHLPFPMGKAAIHEFPHIYELAIWIALVMTMLFFAANVIRLAEDGRRITDALMETQMTLAREQRLYEVGGMAAAAAHELGTPLGTIALVAKELVHALPDDSPYKSDAALLHSQSERCREILQRLSLRSTAGSGDGIQKTAFSTLVKMAAKVILRDGIDIAIENGTLATQGSDAQEVVANVEPTTFLSLEIVYGLRNLIENAVEFARSRVAVRVGWSDQEIGVEIVDDGPGFSRDVLDALGEPYVSSRRDDRGLGLGVFIAKTLLERTGARLEFRNLVAGGAVVRASWQRAKLEVPGDTDDRISPLLWESIEQYGTP